MPGNTILINNVIEYYVDDGKMDELMEWLSKNGESIKMAPWKEIGKEEANERHSSN